MINPLAQNNNFANSFTSYDRPISLGKLLELAIQRAYHDIYVMADLMDKKPDMDKKIDLVHFASVTRKLFTRVYAVVKWARHCEKAYTCNGIVNFLEQQSLLYSHTADSLFSLAKEKLLSAKLPVFSIPTAVDVLSLGTFPRLPKCIEDRIIPPPPVTKTERLQVYDVLERAIPYRLGMMKLSDLCLEYQFGKGKVKLICDGYFKATLTLSGGHIKAPWKLINVKLMKIENGESPIHPMQLRCLKDVIQLKMNNSENPIHEMHNELRCFCLALRLELMVYQFRQLLFERYKEPMVIISDYTLGSSVVIDYWRQPNMKTVCTSYKLTIRREESVCGGHFVIDHSPNLSWQERVTVNRVISDPKCSILKVLEVTFKIRSVRKLMEVKSLLETDVYKTDLLEEIPGLRIRLFNSTDESLTVMVHQHTGSFMLLSERDKDPASIVGEKFVDPAKSPSESLQYLRTYMQKYRIRAFQLKCISFLHGILMKNVPEKKFRRYPNFSFNNNEHIVLIDLYNTNKIMLVIEYSLDGEGKLIPYILLDHGNVPISSRIPFRFDVIRLRKVYFSSYQDFVLKSQYSDRVGTYLPDSQCSVPGSSTSCSLSCCPVRKKDPFYSVAQRLWNQMLLSNRLSYTNQDQQRRGTSSLISWKIELVVGISDPTVLSILPLKQPDIFLWRSHEIRVENTEELYNLIEADWISFCRTYILLHELAYSKETSVHFSYRVVKFDLNKVVLVYGPSFNLKVEISWSVESNSYHYRFSFCKPSATFNPHHLLLEKLKKSTLGQVGSAVDLIKALNKTYIPLISVCSLPGMLRGQAYSVQPGFHPMFTVIFNTLFNWKINFAAKYSLLIDILEENAISVRDGTLSSSLSIYTSMSKEDLSFSQNLQFFLSQFADPTVSDTLKRSAVPTDAEISPSPAKQSAVNCNSPFPQPGKSSTCSPQTNLSVQSPGPFMDSLMHFNILGSPSPVSIRANSPQQPQVSHSPSTFMPTFSSFQDEKMVRSTILQKNTKQSGRLPIYLSYVGFYRMCAAKNLSTLNFPVSSLDIFLGSVYLRGQLHKLLQGDFMKNFLSTMNDGTSIRYHSSNSMFQFEFYLDKTTCTFLIKFSLNNETLSYWSIEDIQFFEAYFNKRVMSYPFKTNAASSAIRLISLPSLQFVKDVLGLLKLEVHPNQNTPWRIQWCSTLPVGLGTNNYGSSSFVWKDRKFIFIINIFLPPYQGSFDPHSQSYIVPLSYSLDTNVVELYDVRMIKTGAYAASLEYIGRNLNELSKAYSQQQPGVCSFLSVVKDLLFKLPTSQNMLAGPSTINHANLTLNQVL